MPKKAKPKDESKGEIVRVRLDTGQRQAIEGAAKRMGVDLSTYLRIVGVRAAREDGFQS